MRHDFSIPALRSLATGRWAIGLHRNTNAYPSALFSVEREFGRSGRGMRKLKRPSRSKELRELNERPR